MVVIIYKVLQILLENTPRIRFDKEPKLNAVWCDLQQIRFENAISRQEQVRFVRSGNPAIDIHWNRLTWTQGEQTNGYQTKLFLHRWHEIKRRIAKFFQIYVET